MHSRQNGDQWSTFVEGLLLVLKYAEKLVQRHTNLNLSDKLSQCSWQKSEWFSRNTHDVLKKSS